MVDYPRASKEELPKLYERLDELADRIETVLVELFETKSRDTVTVCRFEDANEQTYLEVMWEDPEAMVPFFQKVTGLTDREFERQYGHSNIGSLADRKTDFRDEPDAEAFAAAINELMPSQVSLEALLFSFVKLWENDQRRHYRARYEQEVLDFINEQGYPAFKGNKLPGEPDIAIPEGQPFEVIGEIRVIQKKDKQKRFKEFGSEARKAHQNFPRAKFVVVANVGRYIETTAREEVRNEIHRASAAEIDTIVFQDELEQLTEQFEEWGVTRQAELEQ